MTAEIETPSGHRRPAPAARAAPRSSRPPPSRSPACRHRRRQAQARERGLPVIRDTEIEQLLRDYATPILRAAGLAKQNIKVVIINDQSFNAFVTDGRHIFINAGALFQAKTPNQIIGVMAHETGHIAGGHLMRLREQIAQAQTAVDHRHAARRRRHRCRRALPAAAAISGRRRSWRRRKRSSARCWPMRAPRKTRPTMPAVKFLNATHQSAQGHGRHCSSV